MRRARFFMDRPQQHLASSQAHASTAARADVSKVVAFHLFMLAWNFLRCLQPFAFDMQEMMAYRPEVRHACRRVPPLLHMTQVIVHSQRDCVCVCYSYPRPARKSKKPNQAGCGLLAAQNTKEHVVQSASACQIPQTHVDRGPARCFFLLSPLSRLPPCAQTDVSLQHC